MNFDPGTRFVPRGDRVVSAQAERRPQQANDDAEDDRDDEKYAVDDKTA